MCWGPVFDAAIVVVAEERTGLEACLDSLVTAVEHAQTQGIRTFIYVLDNGSSDAVADLADGYHDCVYWRRWERRTGYAQIRNFALRYAARENFPFTIFIDPRTEALPNLIADLVDLMRRHDDLGLVEHQPHQTSTVEEPVFDGSQTVAAPPERCAAADDLEGGEPSWIPGNVFIVSNAMISVIGQFDDTYRTATALDDLCRRALHDRWRIRYTSGAVRHSDPAAARRRPGPWSEAFYFAACETGTSSTQLQHLCQLLATLAIAGLRYQPLATIVKLAAVAAGAAVVACSWHRVLQARRRTRALSANPTWTHREPRPRDGETVSR